MRRCLALILVALLTAVAAACTTAADPVASPSAPATTREAHGTPAPPTPSRPAASPVASESTAASLPIAAAAALAAGGVVRIAARVERAREGEGEDLLVTADALTDVVADRGRAVVDFSGLLAGPDGSPIAEPTLHEIAWDTDWFWGLAEPEDDEPIWARIARDEAPDRGGLLGRMPNELSGLLRAVAEADEDGVGTHPPGELDGLAAARFTVVVRAAELVAEGIPAPGMTSDQFREAYGTDDVGLEVWLVDGELRRIVLVLERERALYGGPDRTELIHDLRPAPDQELEVPPEGRIEER